MPDPNDDVLLIDAPVAIPRIKLVPEGTIVPTQNRGCIYNAPAPTVPVVAVVTAQRPWTIVLIIFLVLAVLAGLTLGIIALATGSSKGQVAAVKDDTAVIRDLAEKSLIASDGYVYRLPDLIASEHGQTRGHVTGEHDKTRKHVSAEHAATRGAIRRIASRPVNVQVVLDDSGHMRARPAGR
jgi:hypothetical protein